MVEKIEDVLVKAKRILSENNIDIKEARILLAHSLKTTKEELIKRKELTEKEVETFFRLINRRLEKEPYAYIVGYKEFMGLKFIVNENVLIPREDTEILVQEAIESNKKNVLDMCTGTGCIAISLAKYIKNAKITASDISITALNTAKQNAVLNNVYINFIQSNLFENIEDKFDLIVSNPPYIRKKDIEKLQEEVKKEPILALSGGDTGLIFYERIIKDAHKYLEKHGILMFEVGYDQAGDVAELLKQNGYRNIRIVKDLNKHDRVVIGEI